MLADQLHHADQSLREKEQGLTRLQVFHESIGRSTSSGVFTTDEEGRITSFNPCRSRSDRLLLAFPDFGAEHYEAWLPEEQREATAAQRREKLGLWVIEEEALRAFVDTTAIHVITPGSQVGEPLHLLSSIERRSKLWDTDVDAAQTSLSAAISLLLRMVGRDPEPAQSKEHVLLSVLAERRLRMGHDAPLGDIVRDVEEPPITEIGVHEMDAFMSPRERNELAAALNGILAAPAFASWRTGATLDVGAWMARGPDNKTPLTIVSVAHLDDQHYPIR